MPGLEWEHCESLLSLTVSESAVACTVRVDGELDPGSVVRLPELIGRLLRDTAPTRILLDLAGVTFIGAPGIRALLFAQRAAMEQGCPVVLWAPSPIVRRALRATGDNRHFLIQDATDRAV